MNLKPGKAGWLTVLGAALAVGLLVVIPANAEKAPTVAPPTWISDSAAYHIQQGSNPVFHFWEPMIQNRYVLLWQYHQGADLTSWNLWCAEGDPTVTGDNEDYYLSYDAMGVPQAYLYPWGSPIYSTELPGRGASNTRPHADFISLRLDDPDDPGTWIDQRFPDNGAARIDFVYTDGRVGPVGIQPNSRATFAPYLYTGGTGPTAYSVIVSQKLSFVRDLLRVELNVRNIGSTTRRVGFRAALSPYADDWGSSVSFTLPQNHDRITFERDYGKAVGTTRPPTIAGIPDSYEVYDDDIGPLHTFVSKGILRGNGAVTPDRVVFGNGLDIFAQSLGGALWDYDIDPESSLQFADLSTLLYWDPVTVGPGQSKAFVTYVGVGVASHGTSAFFQSSVPTDAELRGYVGALQTPFAIPLSGGDADFAAISADCYIYNTFPDLPAGGNTAFVTLPDGLEFFNPNASPTLNLPNTGRAGAVGEEVQDRWVFRANGALAGYLPITVNYGNNLGDTAALTRHIHVPQGRLYQFDDDWRMVTFPFTYANGSSDPIDALGLTAGNFQAVRYNPLINQYEPVSELKAGESYWLRMRGLGVTPVRLNNATAIDLRQGDQIFSSLRRGWNQIGNPSPYAVPVRDLRFITTSAVISFDEAVRKGFIKATLYEYNYRTARYDALTRDSVVSPGRGVWMFSATERNVLWPEPIGPDIEVIP